MSTFIIALFSALCSTQISGSYLETFEYGGRGNCQVTGKGCTNYNLTSRSKEMAKCSHHGTVKTAEEEVISGSTVSQNIKDLNLHAKFGEDLLEYDPPRKHLDLVDEFASKVANKFVMRHFIPKYPTVFKSTYGPIENVVVPGIKLTRPINLTKIRITGLKRLHLEDLQWRMESNRLKWNVTIPLMLVDVTFDNLQIELGKHFNDEEFINTIRLTVRLMGLTIDGSARYNVRPMHSGPNEPKLYIDKAEVDIYARDVLFEINVLHGLEEVRYILAELMNNPLEDIMDAVLEVVVKEINKELLSNVDPEDLKNFLISKLPFNSNVPKDLIAIKSLAVS